MAIQATDTEVTIMTNYELHERAELLADTHSAYELARMYLVETGMFAEETNIKLTVTGPSTTGCDDQFTAYPDGSD